MNINQMTIDALYEVIAECFKMNRFLDRLVSVLGVNFACNNTASKLHHSVAHFFPAFSDKIGESCLERYNITVEYGATPDGKQNYLSVQEMIQLVEDKAVEFQNMLIGAMKIAFQNDDLQVYSELVELIREYSPIVEQAILLNDKIGFYGDDIMLFDSDVDKFWVL